MKSKRSLLKKSPLYLILDKPILNTRSLEKIYSAVSGGEIGVIQLRDKESSKQDILKFAIEFLKRMRKRVKTPRLTANRKDRKALFIINDHIDVAIACGADGLHLGQEDLPLKQARKILGEEKIIGVSCHSLSQALRAQKQGADYIGIGPIYKTATKPGYRPIGLKTLRQLKGKIKIPYFAIGDIREENLKEICGAGAKQAAVCRAILKTDNPKKAAQRIYRILKEEKRKNIFN